MSRKSSESQATGRHPQIREKRNKSLYKVDTASDLAIAQERERGAAGADPYNQVHEKTQISDDARRRSLDDMRRLSEAIKTSPQWTRPQKTTTSTLYRRLSELRAELERGLAEIQGIREGASGSGNRHLVELLGQLRTATYHLEGAVIALRAAGGVVGSS